MLNPGRARQARPTPAAGPLPRGFIDTGDLMPTAPDPTRVDVTSRSYLEGLRNGTQRPVESFGAGRTPALKPPARTVYLTLPRPTSCWNEGWADLVCRIDAFLSPDWVIAKAATALDDDHPAIIWVILCPADLVVFTQDRVMAALEQTRGARAIWAEATPRTLGREGP